MNAFPFAYLLQGNDAPKGFEFWLRAFADPPIRTTRALLANCPRIDWLLWALGKAVAEGELPQIVLEETRELARPYLTQLTHGRKLELYPTVEGLNRIRPFLDDACLRETRG